MKKVSVCQSCVFLKNVLFRILLFLALPLVLAFATGVVVSGDDVFTQDNDGRLAVSAISLPFHSRATGKSTMPYDEYRADIFDTGVQLVAKSAYCFSKPVFNFIASNISLFYWVRLFVFSCYDSSYSFCFATSYSFCLV